MEKVMNHYTGRAPTAIAAGMLVFLGAMASPAFAREGVYWTFNAHAPGVSVGVGSLPPPVAFSSPPVHVVHPGAVYVYPAPVYVVPAPGHVRPAPVYVRPQPVYVRPAPGYYASPPTYVLPAPVYTPPLVNYNPPHVIHAPPSQVFHSRPPPGHHPAVHPSHPGRWHRH
jgi:hypothetical protein